MCAQEGVIAEDTAGSRPQGSGGGAAVIPGKSRAAARRRGRGSEEECP